MVCRGLRIDEGIFRSMTRRILASAAALAAAAVAGTAHATTAPPPALAATLLTVDDFPGSLQVLDREVAFSGIRLHVRTLAPVKLVSHSGTLVSETMLLGSAGEASANAASIARAARTKAGRDAIASSFISVAKSSLGKKVTGGKLRLDDVTVGAPKGVSGGGVSLAVTLHSGGTTDRLTLAFYAVDRLLGALVVDGTSSPADVAQAVGVARKRAVSAFTVANTASPTIAGTAQVGQTLAADGGTWSGGPSTFS